MCWFTFRQTRPQSPLAMTPTGRGGGRAGVWDPAPKAPDVRLQLKLSTPCAVGSCLCKGKQMYVLMNIQMLKFWLCG